ncbi:hypothetical protein, partial [Bacillus cereus]|uniref:hypothetical protein n=1 Tax=Bacillus cereus TaxID=1396 RepID=UPI00178C6355
DVYFSVRKSGVAGTGSGVMAFALLGSDGLPTFKVEKGFTVGADATDGVNEKIFEQTFTIFGDRWDEVYGNAFLLDETKDTIGIPGSLDEWKEWFEEDIAPIFEGLNSGDSQDFNNWTIKRLRN